MTSKVIVANWKMNGSVALIEQLAQRLISWSAKKPHAQAVICPPMPYLNIITQALYDANVFVGAQNCHHHESGAFTGEVSAAMLVEAGCSHVILGHSERRAVGETDALVAQKTLKALNAGLVPIICVGESHEQRKSGNAVAMVAEQAKASLPKGLNAQIMLAYEPIWAIGSGEIPQLDEIAEMHQALKAALSDHIAPEPLVLYGGSVNAANAREILTLDEVGGALIGGASLKPDDFMSILAAAE